MASFNKSNGVKILACFSCALILFVVSSCKKKNPPENSSISSPSSVVSVVSSSIPSSSSVSSRASTTSSSLTSNSTTTVSSSSESIVSSSESLSSSVSSTESSSSNASSSVSISSGTLSSSSESSSSESSSSSLPSSSSEEVKLDFSSDVKMEDKTVTYDGNAHEIVVINAPEGSSIKYKNNKNSYVNAGTYVIEATVSKEGYNDKKITATLTINKANLDTSSIVVTSVENEYSSANQRVTVSGVPSGVSTTIKYYKDSAHTQETTSTKEPGTYYAVVHFNVGENYNEIEDKYGTVVVLKKTYKVPAISINDIPYKGSVISSSDVTIPNLPKDLKISDVKFYATNESSEEIEPIDVGTYYATVTFNNTNPYYNDYQTSTRYEVNIKQKEIDVSWSDLSVTYNGKEKVPSYQLSGDFIEGDDVNVTLVGNKGIKIGEYDYSLTLSGNDAKNYKLNNNTAKMSIIAPDSVLKINSVSEITDGYYVFGLTVNKKELVFLPENISSSGDRVNPVELEKNIEQSKFEHDNIWKITKKDTGYIIQNKDGKYLAPYDKGYKLVDNEVLWSQKNNEDGLYANLLDKKNNRATIKYNDSMKQFGAYGSGSACSSVSIYKVNIASTYNIIVNPVDKTLGDVVVTSSTNVFENLYNFDLITIKGKVLEGKQLDRIYIGETEYEFEYNEETREFTCQFSPNTSGTLVVDINNISNDRNVTVTQVDHLTIVSETKYKDRQSVTIKVTPKDNDHFVKEVIVKDIDGNAISVTKNGDEYSFIMADGKDITITAVAGNLYTVSVTPNEHGTIVLKDKDGNVITSGSKVPEEELVTVSFTQNGYYVLETLKVNDVNITFEKDKDVYVGKFDVQEACEVVATVTMQNATSIKEINGYNAEKNEEFYLTSGKINTLGAANKQTYIENENGEKLLLYRFKNTNEYNTMKSDKIGVGDYISVYGEFDYYESTPELKHVLIVDYVGAVKNITLKGDKITWACNYAKSYDVYDGDTLVAQNLTTKEFTLTDAMKEADVTTNLRIVAHGTMLESSEKLKFTYLKSYSITYKYGDGVREDKVVNKQTIIPESLETPTRENYKFLGWYIDDTKVTEGAKLDGDVVLTAKWAESYTITYVFNNGTENRVDVDAIEIPETLEVPTKENCAFDGWFLDEEFKNKVVPGTKITENTTLYAKWISTHKVTFNQNENVNLPEVSEKGYGEGKDISFIITPKDGYRISEVTATVGDENYEGIIFDSGEIVVTIPTTGDVVINFKTIKTYNVSIIKDSNTNVETIVDITKPVDAYEELEFEVTVNKGYVIDKVLVNETELPISENGEYKIVVDGDIVIKVTSKLMPVTKVSELANDLETVELIRVIYDSSNDSSYIFKDGEDIVYIGKSELTIDLSVGSIYYFLGTSIEDNNIVEFTLEGDTQAILVVSKPKDIAFTDDAKLTWTIDENEKSIIELYINEVKQTLTSTNSFVLTEEMKAKNTPINIKIVHKVNEDSVETQVTMTYYGTFDINFDSGYQGAPAVSSVNSDMIPETLPTLTRDGYIFKGWFLDEDGTKEAVPGTKIKENTTLFAVWEERSNTKHEVIELSCGKSKSKTLFSNEEYSFECNIDPNGDDDNNRGVQFMNSSIESAENSTLIINSKNYAYGVEKVKLNLASNSKEYASIKIKVYIGDTMIGNETPLSSKNLTNYEFISSNVLFGEIKIEISSGATSKSFYIKTIELN